jgi:hypothetical protein
VANDSLFFFDVNLVGVVCFSFGQIADYWFLFFCLGEGEVGLLLSCRGGVVELISAMLGVGCLVCWNSPALGMPGGELGFWCPLAGDWTSE